MKNGNLLFLIVVFLCSCSGSGTPDVSNVKVEIKLERFDRDFFRMDTNNIQKSLKELQKGYPGFLTEYIENILGLALDSVSINESKTSDAVRQFIRDYKPIKDSCEKIFGDFSVEEKEVLKALKFVKFYFPKYHLPGKLITFIGPMDAFFSTSFGIQGDIITPLALGIGLQLHLGKDFSFYTGDVGRDLYPEYISYNFDPKHIAVNAMKNIVDDLYPGRQGGSLIESMVNSGRRYYLLTKFLPGTGEDVLLGYTQVQMKSSQHNESVIWDFFLNNDLLNNSDPNIIKNYVGPSPKTQEFGEGSPGNLGSFAGLQIVKKFMDQNQKVTLDSLMQLPPREIYERSKYKPRS